MNINNVENQVEELDILVSNVAKLNNKGNKFNRTLIISNKTVYLV